MTGDIGFPFQPPPSEPFPKEEPSPKSARKKVRARRQGKGPVVQKSSDQSRAESLAHKVGQPPSSLSHSTRKRKFSERAEPSSPLVQESMQAEPAPKRRFIEVITSSIANMNVKQMVARSVAEAVATYIGGPVGLALMKGAEAVYDFHQHNITSMESNVRTLLTAALHSQGGVQVAVAADVVLLVNDLRRSSTLSVVSSALGMITGNPIMNAAGADNPWKEAYNRIMESKAVQDALLFLFTASSDIAKSFVEAFANRPEELQSLTATLTQRAQELAPSS